MKKLKIIVISIVCIIFIVACGNTKEESKAIRIGSKDFTESNIVSELYALALKDAGYEVEQVMNIASSVIHTSIINDEIDLYPEYTGTGLLSVLQFEMETDPDKVYEIVKEEYDKQFSLTWLEYSKANDGQGLFISTEVAKTYGIETISDLQVHATEVRFASQGEFDHREDGIPRLTEIYGAFEWKSSAIYDNGLKYEIVKNKEADVAPAYTTEGQLIQEEFTLLVDDKQAWPPYNLAPVVKNNILEENKEMEEILNKISDALDTETLTALNAKVDVDKEEYETVAAQFYETIK